MDVRRPVPQPDPAPTGSSTDLNAPLPGGMDLSVCNGIPIGLSLLDPAGSLIYANAALCDLMGRDQGDIAGETFDDLFFPEDRDAVRSGLQDLLDGDQADRTLDMRLRKADGDAARVRATLRLERDKDGTPRRFIVPIEPRDDIGDLESALVERVKQLTCLQSISAIMLDGNDDLDLILDRVVRILPPSWLYVEDAAAVIELDDRVFGTSGFERCVSVQEASLRVDGKARGRIAVGYLSAHRDRDEGPFLKEERSLIDAVAERLGRDVERIEMREALRRSERDFSLVVEQAPDMIYMMSLPSGEYAYVSPAVERIFGLTPKEFGDCPATIRDLIHPDWRAYFQEQWTNLLAGEAPPVYEYQIIHPSGEVRWLNQRNLLVRDADGRPTALWGIVSDVTEVREDRRRLAESLREIEIRNRIAEVFLTTPGDGLYTKVLDIVLEALESPHGVFGFIDEAGDLVVPSMTRHIWDACQVPDKTWVFPRSDWGDSSWPTAIRERHLIHVNERSRLTPEGHIPIENHISCPINFREEAIGLILVGNKEGGYAERDLERMQMICDSISPILKGRLDNERLEGRRRRISMQLQANARELERSNEELAQFAYVASHDLQEPLRMVASYSQLLAERYQDQLDEKANLYIEFAVDGARRMQQLINDLLTYSRVGTHGKAPEPVDSGEVLAVVLADLGGRIEEVGAKITVGDLPVVLADRTQLAQVFQNLVGNALKFMSDRPPEVEVSAERDGGAWAITVADNGIGIEPEYHERIFFMFQRLHARRRYSGSGIGLAVVKKIVERHGGKIRLESQPDQGSRFTFSLPSCGQGDGDS